MVGDEETEPRLFDTREEAAQEGRRLADESGGELLIHDETGETETKGQPG